MRESVLVQERVCARERESVRVSESECACKRYRQSECKRERVCVQERGRECVQERKGCSSPTAVRMHELPRLWPSCPETL